MNNEVMLQNWEDFEAEVSKLNSKLPKRKKKLKSYVSPALFRGHTKKCWKLETSLERFSSKVYKLQEYFNLLRAIKPGVESLTSRLWNLPNKPNFTDSVPRPPPGYEFMIYLRHYGFPSPLLDWSSSPYIAAFFAFHSHQIDTNTHVAIFAYVEDYGYGKKGYSNEARIVSIGPYITTDSKHYKRQSQYTICRKQSRNGFVYCSHEEVFAENYPTQDILIKFLIPISERSRVLCKLDAMNINPYSLFGDENSLMATLAYREIEKVDFLQGT